MAQQIIDLGTVANDGSGSHFRVGADMINDNFTELYIDVAALQAAAVTAADIIRSKFDESCNGGNDQVISFSSQFVSNHTVSIIDYQGRGIEQKKVAGVPVQDADGFTINSLSAGAFGWLAVPEI